MAFWTFLGLAKGKATTEWPRAGADDGQKGVLGMPRFQPEFCVAECEDCASACVTHAITPAGSERDGSPLDIDYGRCIACQLCVEACPTDAMTSSFDWAFGVQSREDLKWTETSEGLHDHLEHAFGAFRRSLHIRHVDAGSCNGCESELQALNNPFYNLHRLGIFFTPSPRFADLLLVTGPVTHAMQDALRATYEAMPEPKWVMAVGTCAVSGGVAEGGYACGHGLDGVIPVDLYLPGCPPNPAALIEALLMFLGRMPQRVRGGKIGK